MIAQKCIHLPMSDRGTSTEQERQTHVRPKGVMQWTDSSCRISLVERKTDLLLGTSLKQLRCRFFSRSVSQVLYLSRTAQNSTCASAKQFSPTKEIMIITTPTDGGYLQDGDSEGLDSGFPFALSQMATCILHGIANCCTSSPNSDVEFVARREARWLKAVSWWKSRTTRSRLKNSVIAVCCVPVLTLRQVTGRRIPRVWSW